MMRKYVLSLLSACAVIAFAAQGMVQASSYPPQMLSSTEQLGKELFFDTNLSTPKFQSCATCHNPEVGWTGPDMYINAHGAVYEGAVRGRFGNRKPPSSGYATVSPNFYYNEDEGLFVGGNFWDGRATGWDLGNPAADQARGPFLNPVEQNNPDKKTVVYKVCKSAYAGLFKSEFMVKYPGMNACDPANTEKAYDFIALAIGEYEDSSEVNQFTSKYDYYKKGMATLTEQEMEGMELFEGKGKCVLCHVMDGQGPNGEDLFTDFTFDNIGVPKNPKNPFYRMDKVYVDGKPINPDGKYWIDPGLGGFLKVLADEDKQMWRKSPYVTNVKDLINDELMAMAKENYGKHKVPTLRNVDLKMHDGFVKAYMHNGVLKSLKEVVHFYNTRDVEDWPAPEVPQNVNEEELGDLGLTEAEENAIVAFMKTLSDGYMTPLTGERLYMNFCKSCHGSAEPANMMPPPTAPRKVIGARTCSIKGAIYGTYVFKGGVYPMRTFKGAFTDMQTKMISDYLNDFNGINGQQRFTTTCAGCHGMDAKGGRVDEDIRGEDAHDIFEAIQDEDPMYFLKCLLYTPDDIHDIGYYLMMLDYDDDD